MTFRAKPVVKRSRNPWDSQDRRTFLTSVAFALVIVAALLILVVAVGYTWYDTHLAPVGSVAGQSITKDEFSDRLKIEAWRLQEQERRIANQVASGRLSDAQAEQARQFLSNQAQQIQGLALERIIDNRIQANRAAEEGVSVTDADIAAKLVEEATTPAARHLWVIEVEPAVSDGALEPTTAQIAEARTNANEARADVEGGAKWEDVAKSVSIGQEPSARAARRRNSTPRAATGWSFRPTEARLITTKLVSGAASRNPPLAGCMVSMTCKLLRTASRRTSRVIGLSGLRWK
jgi:hypothetical protein